MTAKEAIEMLNEFHPSTPIVSESYDYLGLHFNHTSEIQEVSLDNTGNRIVDAYEGNGNDEFTAIVIK